ncbi:Fe-S-containing hydro-lyase [Salisediminibacterium beveridgei]|uniref:Fumarate / L(+)-tartrate hydratase, beta subunit n=1 Tax=Salisediminibacterium beveridgei TaxID=632773 RepID=A0A1D7QX21_9BACI|nr:Fe-S-containing hydro-lyase [Salisediminibacterium beveridgei]AOM83563.1 Fumarate / L(+)-tartrate hydratase, beta subunit [Salisediminibacterium beveridgei]
MAEAKQITIPLDEKQVAELKAGDLVTITGTIYTARDAAHKKMIEAMENGEKLPFDVKDQVIYYAGPTPAKPGKIIGSCGPTTSGRMDAYSPALLEHGLKGMIGKGPRSETVIDAMKKHNGIYFAAVGGAAALISDSITEVEIVAYEDLGPEAIRKMEVVDYPCVVAIDSKGNNLYEDGVKQYKTV